MNFVVIIPARFASVRFPGKLLADVHGKPMIVRVMERALDSGASKVIIATDSVEIAKVIELEQSKGEVCLTQSFHQSGIERIGEVAQYYNFTSDQIIVHLQGDEPFISSDMIFKVVDVLHAMSHISMVTLAIPMPSVEKANDSNIVKVVLNADSHALYFSRSIIPWRHDGDVQDNYSFCDGINANMLLQHIGVYSYTVGFLYRYISWNRSPLEQIEKLEQLRVLWYGESIYVSVIKDGMYVSSINTPHELLRINEMSYFEKLLN